jgi:hypothetical protein
MGKKGKGDAAADRIQARSDRAPFSFLGIRVEGADAATIKKHVIYLVAASLAVKLLVLFATVAVFHSFIDLFDIGVYFQHGAHIFEGQIPDLDYSVEYPALFLVPVTIAFIPVIAVHNAEVFLYSFPLLMVLCDLITLICVYLIGLKVMHERNAFVAGLLYATAFSAAYFVLMKYDAFPTCLLMLALLFTVYGARTKGYLSATLGAFAKMFPVLVLPFMVAYNTRSTSLKEECVNAAKVIVPVAVILLLPLAVLSPASPGSYISATGYGLGVYVNSATYTLYAWIGPVLGTGAQASAVSTFMYALMGAGLLVLLYVAFRDRRQKPLMLLKLAACAIFVFVLFTKFHSPQYIVWFTPLLAVLVADDIIKIVAFYAAQARAHIEFPLLYGRFYTNLEYANPAGSGNWYLTLIFFTIEYVAFIVLFLLILRPDGGYRSRARALMKSYLPVRR